jgi:hypothetical protein
MRVFDSCSPYNCHWNSYLYTQSHAFTHTGTHICTSPIHIRTRHTRSYTRAFAQSHRHHHARTTHPYPSIHTHRDTQHTPTRIPTYTYTCIRKETYACTQSHAFTHTYAHRRYIYTQTLSHSGSRIHIDTHSHTLPYTHAHTGTHGHADTNKYTHRHMSIIDTYMQHAYYAQVRIHFARTYIYKHKQMTLTEAISVESGIPASKGCVMLGASCAVTGTLTRELIPLPVVSPIMLQAHLPHLVLLVAVGMHHSQTQHNTCTDTQHTNTNTHTHSVTHANSQVHACSESGISL